MRKIFIILLIIFYSKFLYCYEPEDISLSNWNTYTNTTYIHQIICQGDSIIAATWGGVSIFNKLDSTFSTLVKSDGLSKNEIRSLHYIEKTNEFWFGTYLEGISRYKSEQFLKPYMENQGVEGDYINDIDDNNDFVFVGTEKGLVMFEIIDDETIFKKTFIAPRWISDNSVNCITFDDSNRIWIGTNQGIDYTNITYDDMILQENWFHINCNTLGYPLLDEKITCIDYNNGNIYFGTENGFAIINEIYSDSLDFFGLTQNLPSSEISSILAVNDSVVWVAFGEWNETNQMYDNANGIGKYNILDSLWQFWNEEDSTLFNKISDIQIDKHDNVWIGTWEDGLYCYEDNEWRLYKSNCINCNLVTVMMFDQNNNLWCGFGTNYPSTTPKGIKGLSKFNGEDWTNYRSKQSSTDYSLWSDRIFRMSEDQNNNKWFGTWGHGLGKLSSSEMEWTIYKVNNTDWLLGNQISIVECDNSGNMWLGSYGAGPGGVTILLTDSTYHQFTPPVLISGHADMWTILLEENNVWLGGRYTGVQYWDAPGFPQTGFEQFWSSASCTEGKSCFNFDIQRTDYGNYIFASCEDGLYMFDKYWDEWFKYTNGIVENVKQYYWDGENWVNWLYYWFDEEENPETRMGYGKSNQVNAVFVDPHSRKWIATNGGGISVLDVDNYYFTNFNTENSNLCSDVVLSFAYNSYSGELFVGTTEGLCSFKIGSSNKDPSLSKIVEKINVFPNPFVTSRYNEIYFEPYPDKELPFGKNLLYIYNLSGELITILEESDQFRFCWDGKNQSNKTVSSGIYFYVLSSEFGDIHITGKFAIIR